MKPIACYPEKLSSLTFYFNVIFYLLYFTNKKFFGEFSGNAVIILVLSQYLMWVTHFWKKCDISLSKAIFGDIISHWLPFIIALFYIKQWSVRGFTFGLIMIFFYNLKFDKKLVYDYFTNQQK